MKVISGIRKNIGTIIAAFGFLLLCIITFGNLADITTEQYWHNVKDKLTSIGIMTVALSMIQVSIKQGVAEQALQRGLNTPETTAKWNEHKQIIKFNQPRIRYMPYFLQTYNERQTLLKKREFLVNNNFTSEQALLQSKNRRMIKHYQSIKTYITLPRIKWATTDVVYNKHGQIITLAEHRSKRTFKGVLHAMWFMLGMTLLTTGLFIADSGEKLLPKFIKLGTYVLTISITSVYAIVKEYEKGAFGVPNELEELNNIWQEFQDWVIPAWVIQEVEELNKPKEVIKNAQKKEIDISYGIDARTALQNKPQESKMAENIHPHSAVCVSCAGDFIPDTAVQSRNNERERDSSL